MISKPFSQSCLPADEDDLKLQRIGTSENPQNHVLFSGCKDTQTSADAYISGTYNGAFTYYFCKHLRDVQGAITRAELLKRLRASLKHEGYDQIPQLECPAAAKKKKLLE
jgi:hypothetical protein